MTSMSKLDIRVTGLALSSPLYPTGGTCMPSKKTQCSLFRRSSADDRNEGNEGTIIIVTSLIFG
jgi:hypothetical protein